MDAFDVGLNLLGLAGAEVAIREMFEMGVDFIGIDLRGQKGLYLFAKVSAELALRHPMGGVRGQGFVGLVMETAEEAVLESVPQVFARPHGVGESV